MTNPGRFRIPCAALAALLAVVAASTHAVDTQDPQLRAAMPETPAVPSPVSVPLDARTLARLPRHQVVARTRGDDVACEGVALIDVLRDGGTIPEGPLQGPQLSRYVLVDGRDGDRVLFSLAELDAGTGTRETYVVDRCGGHTLDSTEGPLRLLVAGEGPAARSVRQLHTITLVAAP